MKKSHVVAYYERKCQTCERKLVAKVYDYGLLDSKSLDEQLGKINFELRPFACPICKNADFPETFSMYDESGKEPKLLLRETIGTEELPVMGEEGPYGMVRSAEEQAEYDRGLEKVSDVWENEKAEFWHGYCQWAMEDWRKAVSELQAPEIAAGSQAVGISLLPGSASVAAWRKAVRELEDEKRSAFWQSANKYMIEESILYVYPDHWDIDRFVKRYGRERIRYVMLHVPLPEELEKWRTEAIAKLVKKKQSGDAGVLFARIGQLGKELERQRRRSEHLSQQCFNSS